MYSSFGLPIWISAIPFIVEQTIMQGLFGTFGYQIRQRVHELPNVSISSGDMGRGRTISWGNTSRMCRNKYSESSFWKMHHGIHRWCRLLTKELKTYITLDIKLAFSKLDEKITWKNCTLLEVTYPSGSNRPESFPLPFPPLFHHFGGPCPTRSNLSMFWNWKKNPETVIWCQTCLTTNASKQIILIYIYIV